MAGFSWKTEKELAIKTKVRRAITQVQGDNPNKDIAIRHPEWIKQAQSKQYTELTKSITDSVQRAQDRVQARRDMIAGKNKHN